MLIKNEEFGEFLNKLIMFCNVFNLIGFLNFLRYISFLLLFVKFFFKVKRDLFKVEEFCKYFFFMFFLFLIIKLIFLFINKVFLLFFSKLVNLFKNL